MTHAIVIGGSMAGLLTARVLTDHFDQVTVVERDHYPENADVRKGVPQARHVHALLARGQEIMEQLFPGLDNDFAAAGLLSYEWGSDSLYLTAGGWLKRFNTGIITRLGSRAAIDHIVHRRLISDYKVTFLEDHQVDGLVTTPGKTRVIGVQVTQRGGSRTQQTLNADLIIDATGRGSKAGEWLTGMGYTAPEETVVNSYVGYATRWYEKPDDPSIDWKVLFILARPPQLKRGAAIFEVEGNKWIATLAGVNKDYPPLDEAGWLEFSKGLPTLAFYEAIKNAKPISDISGYQRTSNHWRHYEKLSRFPDGLMIVGDAVCAFNPIYGQGMTVAALDALLLDKTLKANAVSTSGLSLKFQRELGASLKTVWLMATGEDLRYPETEGFKPDTMTRFMQKYMDQVAKLLPKDEAMTLAFIDVSNFRKPPTSLFSPRIVAKVIAEALKGGETLTGGKELAPAPALSH